MEFSRESLPLIIRNSLREYSGNKASVKVTCIQSVGHFFHGGVNVGILTNYASNNFSLSSCN